MADKDARLKQFIAFLKLSDKQKHAETLLAVVCLEQEIKAMPEPQRGPPIRYWTWTFLCSAVSSE
jgi:hypothetical protein